MQPLIPSIGESSDLLGLSHEVVRRVFRYVPLPNVGPEFYRMPDEPLLTAWVSLEPGQPRMPVVRMLPALNPAQAFDAADIIHQEIHVRQNESGGQPYGSTILNFLILARVGIFDAAPWAATFEGNPQVEWYELDRITVSPVTARGATPAEAICRACLLVADLWGWP